jgi:hypothetical protein
MKKQIVLTALSILVIALVVWNNPDGWPAYILIGTSVASIQSAWHPAKPWWPSWDSQVGDWLLKTVAIVTPIAAVAAAICVVVFRLR